MPTFEVVVQRMALVIMETRVNVEADSLDEAKAEALAEASAMNESCTWEHADDAPSLTNYPAWVDRVFDEDGEEVEAVPL